MHNNRDVVLHARMYEQQPAFYNRSKNCVNNGLAIRYSRSSRESTIPHARKCFMALRFTFVCRRRTIDWIFHIV